LPGHRPGEPAADLPGDRQAGEDAAPGAALCPLSRGLPAAGLGGSGTPRPPLRHRTSPDHRRAMIWSWFAEPRLVAVAVLAPLAAAALAVWLWRRRLAADAAWAARGLWS